MIDFIDMVLESNRDLVLRRLIECLGRDRTKHQVAEVTSLGLVQMTRKRVGQGLLEAFSEPCAHCNGRGFIIHSEPVDSGSSVEPGANPAGEPDTKRPRRKKAAGTMSPTAPVVPVLPEAREAVKATLATIAAAAAHAHEHRDKDVEYEGTEHDGTEHAQEAVPDEAAVVPEAAETELADAIESVEAVEVTDAAAAPTEEPHEV